MVNVKGERRNDVKEQERVCLPSLSFCLPSSSSSSSSAVQRFVRASTNTAHRAEQASERAHTRIRAYRRHTFSFLPAVSREEKKSSCIPFLASRLAYIRFQRPTFIVCVWRREYRASSSSSRYDFLLISVAAAAAAVDARYNESNVNGNPAQKWKENDSSGSSSGSNSSRNQKKNTNKKEKRQRHDCLSDSNEIINCAHCS